MSKLSPLLAASLLIAAGAASAQATETAPLTRAAVIAELAAARSSGELAVIQGEMGVEVAVPASAKAAVATATLPRQAVLTAKPTAMPRDARVAAAEAADHGENAARELGDFPVPTVHRASALAGR
ncbi:MAG: DUF4148 domain-containing protein [Roseateles sp.]|uniref:DUF4148 domain-containing protein n=1 Tax=Roseateles sp. TaxID=1971397 RepID=UPI0039EB7A69